LQSANADQHRDRITRFATLKHRAKNQENYLFTLAKFKENYEKDVKNEESIKALRAKFAERRAARATEAKKEGISESRTSAIRAKIKARLDESKQKTNDPVAMVAEAMSGDLSLFSL
jgi:hypothetical protein